MKAKHFLFVLFLVIQSLSIGMFATTDDIAYDVLGLSDDNGYAEDFSGVSVTSSAEYSGSLEVASGEIIFRNGEGVLASSATGGYVSSVTIYWGSSAVVDEDQITIWAQDSEYSGTEVDGDGDEKDTYYYDGSSSVTYDFDADYAFVLLMSYDVAHIDHIEIEWTVRSDHAITRSFAHGTFQAPVTTSAYVGDVVTLTWKKNDTYALTGYSIFKTADPSIKVIPDVSHEPRTANQAITFTMPDYPVTVEGTFVLAPTTSLTVTFETSGKPSASNLNGLTTMTSGETLIYTYTAPTDYNGTITATTSNSSNAQVEVVPTNAYSGQLVIHPYSAGAVKVTISFAATTKYTTKAYNSNSKSAVSRRPVALVTVFNDKYYAVTQDLSSGKLAPLELLLDAGNYYYDPTSGYDVSDVRWYIETIYNALGDQYRIFTTSSGTARISTYGENFVLSSTDYTFLLGVDDGFYGFSDSKGLVYNSLADPAAFVAKDHDAHSTMSQFSQAAFEVPIANIVQARRFSSYDEEDIIDERSFSIGQLATICVPFNAPLSFAHGATFYRLTGKTVSGDNLTAIIMEEVEGNLEGGGCYMMEMTATELDIYGGVEVDEASKDASDGFLGRGGWEPSALPATGGVTPRKNGYYGLKSNQLHYIAAGSNPTPKAYRAYVNAGELSAGGGSSSPRRRVLTVYGAENVATDLSNVNDASLINWNEPVYNIMGMQVAKGATGVLIQNGQKFLAQ